MGCKQCGECCKRYYISLNEDDYRVWEKSGRDDILEVADVLFDGKIDGERHRSGDGFWREGGLEPTPTGSKSCLFLMYQPHLKKYVCRIHDVKPWICKQYERRCNNWGDTKARI